MKRKDFLKMVAMTPVLGNDIKLAEFAKLTSNIRKQPKKMPVLFTAHGNPMDIVKSRDERPFWNCLYQLGKDLEKNYEVQAAVVVSAHWLTRGTHVNVSPFPKQIYDFGGFPEEFYKVIYQAPGAPEIAREITRLSPNVYETTDWGLDHGAWPMLMHLFPNANIPVFQMSIDYHASPAYHYNLAQELRSLRDKGVLIIGSGSLIHNLPLASKKFFAHDSTQYGWETEYDAWIKSQIDTRNFKNVIEYETSHKLGKLAAPTPDHFVPVLYSLGLMDTKDEINHFFEDTSALPAYSERSFLIGTL
jgi:4,5-DOPA dioxygenase extradiol